MALKSKIVAAQIGQPIREAPSKWEIKHINYFTVKNRRIYIVLENKKY
jgi:hypothetical protein